MPKCNCETCRLIKVLRAIRFKCIPDECAALNELWERMECAEMDLDVAEAKRRGEWPTGPDDIGKEA